MSRSADLLRESAIGDLLQLHLAVEHPWIAHTSTTQDRENAASLGRSLFTQLSRVCKLALDAGDEATFITVEQAWTSMFEDTIVHDELELRTPEQQSLAPLLRQRDILRLGLAMWATHLLTGSRRSHNAETCRTALQRLASRFGGLDQLLDVYEDALDRDNSGGGGDWTSWFLGELDPGRTHVIPTRQQLLTAMLLVATGLARDQGAVRPREWMRHTTDDIDATLDRLDADAERWSWLVATETVEPENLWHERIAAVRQLLHEALDEELARQAAELRQAPIDPDRACAFEKLVRSQLADARVIRDTFRQQHALASFRARPPDVDALVSSSWLPKTLFVPNSKVFGLERLATGVGREAIAEEGARLFNALAGCDIRPMETDATTVRATVADAIANMTGLGQRPSLLLLPLAWRLKERLGLPVSRADAAPDHPLIPAMHRKRFAGVVNDVPAIDLARMPDDRFYLLDLRSALLFIEWPSLDDAGVDVTLRSFDTAQAESLVRENPGLTSEGQSADEATRVVQEQVLLELRPRWSIRVEDRSAVRAFDVPDDLRRTAH